MPNPLMTPHKGVSFQVTIKIDPSYIDNFLEALRPCWTAVCKEPDLLYFDVFHSQSEPGTFRFAEVWAKDSEWLKEHQLTKDYYLSYSRIIEPMLLSREVEALDRLRGWNHVDNRYFAKE